jgi:hypothetical protein
MYKPTHAACLIELYTMPDALQKIGGAYGKAAIV